MRVIQAQQTPGFRGLWMSVSPWRPEGGYHPVPPPGSPCVHLQAVQGLWPRSARLSTLDATSPCLTCQMWSRRQRGTSPSRRTDGSASVRVGFPSISCLQGSRGFLGAWERPAVMVSMASSIHQVATPPNLELGLRMDGKLWEGVLFSYNEFFLEYCTGFKNAPSDFVSSQNV